MKQNLIDTKKYSKICLHCFYGRLPKDGESVLCEKKGIVDLNGKCKKYKYDPLKRKPDRLIIDKNFSDEDFKL